MKKHLFPVLLWGALCAASPAMAQQPTKADAVAHKPFKSAAFGKLRAEQTAFKGASVALAPDSMTRPKGDKRDSAILTETFPGPDKVALRGERARKIGAHALELKRELVAQKADAKYIKALDGLIADAKAVEAGVVALVGEDGKRAFDAGDGVSKRLAASDAQAKRLQASLESTLGLVEPFIGR